MKQTKSLSSKELRSLMLLAKNTIHFPKRNNWFKHIKTSFSSTSGSGNLSGFGELIPFGTTRTAPANAEFKTLG